LLVGSSIWLVLLTGLFGRVTLIIPEDSISCLRLGLVPDRSISFDDILLIESDLIEFVTPATDGISCTLIVVDKISSGLLVIETLIGFLIGSVGSKVGSTESAGLTKWLYNIDLSIVVQ
jgi:hypothetical protein